MHYLFFSVFILGLNFWKKRSAFSGNVWEKLWLSTPKQSWDQWTQSNMQMEHKSPDGPLSSMQNIGGKWDQWSQVACPSMITMQYAICQDVLRRDDMICESPTWTTSEVSGLKFEKKMHFQSMFGKIMSFRPKMRGIGEFCVGINDHNVTCQYVWRRIDIICTWNANRQMVHL